MPADRSEKRQHELRTWPRYFERLLDGTKTFEVRKDDRGFRVGDVLWLREWKPSPRGFTGRSLRKQVVFIYDGDADLGLFHLTEGTVVMGLAPMHSLVGHAHDAFVNAEATALFGRTGDTDAR